MHLAIYIINFALNTFNLGLESNCLSNDLLLSRKYLLSSNPQPPSKNDIELKEKIGDAEKEAQRGENRHKEA